MDLAFNHLFADHDSCLESMLHALRRERRHAQGRTARGLAEQALREIELLRDCRGLSNCKTPEQWLEDALAASPYEQFKRAVQEGRHRLNPIAEAMDAARNAVEDRRALRHLLALHITHAAKVARKSAVLVWAMARTVWRKLLARVLARFPIRRANGFFGVSKVDGRNAP